MTPTTDALPRITRDGPRVTIVGALVQENRQQAKELVLDALEQGERAITVHLEQCDYLDSAGLGVLVSISKRCRDVNASLTLSGLNADLRDLFVRTKLDLLFTRTNDRA